jgi:hypothetical protein
MLPFVADRKQLKIFVNSAAKEVVSAFANGFDMTEQGVASRVYEWFGRQPEDVQKWILGLVRGDEGTGMKRYARQLLSGRPAAEAITAVEGTAQVASTEREGERSNASKPRSGRSPKPASAARGSST